MTITLTALWIFLISLFFIELSITSWCTGKKLAGMNYNY